MTVDELPEEIRKRYIKEHSYCVYALRSPEGKIYIGHCEMPAEKRWANGTNYRKNKALNEDIIKFGWENFTREVIHDEISKEEAEIREAQLIVSCETTNPEKGYNGYIPKINPNRQHYTVYQLVFPDGKQYVGKTGMPFEKRWKNGSGHKFSKELKAAIEECGEENVYINIACEGLDFEGASALENILIEWNHTNDPAHGYNKSVGGEKESGWHLKAETRRKMSRRQKGKSRFTPERRRELQLNTKTGKAVLCVETGKQYVSMKEAARQTGTCAKSIEKVLHGQRKTAGGFHWQKVDD